MNAIKGSAFLEQRWQLTEHIFIFIHIVLRNISKKYNARIGFYFMPNYSNTASFHISLQSASHLIYITKLHKLYFIYCHIIMPSNKALCAAPDIVKHLGARHPAAVH